MMLKGAQAVMACLKEHGVDTIFGFPGGTVLSLYDALYDESSIRHILTAHEQGATHAADGYARATGKTGVVLVTSGPGAANTVTGIATAYRDSVPLVILTGQVSRSLLGKASFQELDIVDITKSITKKSILVDKPEKLVDAMRDAFRLAAEGRPGPVLVDIPKDIQAAEVEYIPLAVSQEQIEVQTEPPLTQSLEASLTLAIQAINRSQKPVIYAGGGVRISNAYEDLKDFSEKIKAPVACSLMGTDVFPGDHPYAMGMLGMHGSQCANTAITQCDLLIAVGARFSDRATCKPEGFAPKAEIIHIDIDPAEFGKNIDTHIPVCGDIKMILKRLNTKIPDKRETGWNRQIQEWKEKYDTPYKSNGKLSPQFLINSLSDLTQSKSIITTEVGQNQMWTAQYYRFSEPRCFISSGGLGTMGFGLGAAIGAAVGSANMRPDHKVINIAGDGSFRMNMNELATVAKYKLPIIQLVLNNRSLGMVYQWQKIFYQSRFSHTVIKDETDFIKIAKGFGIKTMKITKNSQVAAVLKKALAMHEPVLIECDIHPDDLVFPMVPAGEPLNAYISSFGNDLLNEDKKERFTWNSLMYFIKAKYWRKKMSV